jgi:hypothetical protein
MSEQEFLSLLQLIFAEVETAFIVFHSFDELNRLAISNEAILAVLNEDAQFWKGYRACLQTTLLMTLSRLFDPDPDTITFQSLVTATVANPQLFDRASLGSGLWLGRACDAPAIDRCRAPAGH